MGWNWRKKFKSPPAVNYSCVVSCPSVFVSGLSRVEQVESSSLNYGWHLLCTTIIHHKGLLSATACTTYWREDEIGEKIPTWETWAAGIDGVAARAYARDYFNRTHRSQQPKGAQGRIAPDKWIFNWKWYFAINNPDPICRVLIFYAITLVSLHLSAKINGLMVRSVKCVYSASYNRLAGIRCNKQALDRKFPD